MSFCRKLLFVDMDGVLVKWMAAKQVEDLLQPGYFRNLPPQENVVQAIHLLQQTGVSLFILSSYINDCENAVKDKNLWLDEFAPFIESGQWFFVPNITTKPEYVKGLLTWMKADMKNCYLLDDYTKNIRDWSEAGGKAIKLLNDVNGQNGTYQALSEGEVRFDSSPGQIARGILSIMYPGVQF